MGASAPRLTSRKLVMRETVSGYLFLLPSLVFFLVFVIYPMFMCIYTSFFDSNMGKNTTDVFVGLANYKELFQDQIFLGALKNTLIIVVVSVPTVCAFSLWVATAIYDMKPALTSAFRCIFYLPVVTGSVAVTVVWKWMYNNYYGIFNYVGKSMGFIEKNINWLGDAKYALWCIILILFTTSVGQPIVLYVSALGNVDHSLVEAAEVDGANRSQVFWRIKWHQIMPTTLYILIITTINSFVVFYTTAETSAFRFGFMKWMIPLSLAYPIVLLLVTGHGYFAAHIPSTWTNFLSTHNIFYLSTMLLWMTGITLLKTFGCAIAMLRQKAS